MTVILDNADRLNGIIREKTKFPELVKPDGSIERKAFARYFVSLTNRPDEEALVDADHIVRDRKNFTKQMLRSFLKNSINREPWNGAPWLVKTKLAEEYRINTGIPHELSYDYQMCQRNAQRTLKRAEGGEVCWNSYSPNGRLPELKPKSHKGKNTQQDIARSKQEHYLEYQRALAGSGTPLVATNGNGIPHPNDPQYIHFISRHPDFHMIASKNQPKPAPPPIPKYPIEDLEVPPIHNAAPRPLMKFLSEDIPNSERPSEGAGSGIRMESVGLLLETWDTLNVYCEVFILDSFTLDDYIEALQFTSEEVQCELLVEIHCAVLKKLVNHEKDLNGQVQITLPIALQDDTDDESSAQGNSTEATPTPEPEIKPRTTRSSIAKTEAAELKAQAAIDAKLHRGAEIDQCVKGYNWRVRLRKRDFSNGRWVVIVVGLLSLYAASPRHKKICDDILIQLAPLDMGATEEVAISQYARLDINLRVKIVQFLCMLSLETNSIRGYMEECTLQMTQFRKEKVETQRTRKTM